MTKNALSTENDSILLTIKKLIGIDETTTAFDTDIITAINTTLFTLQQIGIGSPDAFVVSGVEDTWKDIIGGSNNFEAIKTYIYLKVRLIFDPPSNSFLQTSIENQIRELEWRLCFQSEFESNVHFEDDLDARVKKLEACGFVEKDGKVCIKYTVS